MKDSHEKEKKVLALQAVLILPQARNSESRPHIFHTDHNIFRPVLEDIDLLFFICLKEKYGNSPSLK